MNTIDILEKNIGFTLPEGYKRYISDIDTYKYVEFQGDSESRDWYLYGIKELTNEVKVSGSGKEPFYRCLGLFLKCYFDFIGKRKMIKSPVGYIEPERVEGAFVIGEENGDYLYLDSKENFSVWIYYHDGSEVKRLSPNFKYFQKKIKEIEI